MLHDSIILQIIGQSLYDKYSYFRSKRNLERNPDNKFCSVYSLSYPDLTVRAYSSLRTKVTHSSASSASPSTASLA